jgi:hypothetical protein
MILFYFMKKRASLFILLGVLSLLCIRIFHRSSSVEILLQTLTDNVTPLWTNIEEKEKAKFLLELLKFIATSGGAIFVWLNFKVAQENRNLAEEKIDSETFAKCIDQLDKDKSVSTRLGGIFTLEQIAINSTKYHFVVMKVLASFLTEINRDDNRLYRGHSILVDNKKYEELSHEFLAALAALVALNKLYSQSKSIGSIPKNRILKFFRKRDRKSTQLIEIRNLEFKSINLRDLDLSGFDLSGSKFLESLLDSTTFTNSKMFKVDFSGSSLGGADFTCSTLEDSSFADANLCGANFQDAKLANCGLENTNLSDAKVEGATFDEVDVLRATLKVSAQ